MTRPHLPSARWAARFFTICIVLIGLGGLASNIIPFYLDDPTPGQIYWLLVFQLDAEMNPPTFFATFLLASNAVLLWLAGGRRHPTAPTRPVYWRLLSLIFVFLAVDELVSIHEHVGEFLVVNSGLNLKTSILWVVPWAAGVAIIAVAFRGFLLRLPRTTALRFLIAGGLYVMGAIGFEIISSTLWELSGWSLRYTSLALTEELLELIGQAYFAVTLLDYIARSQPYRARRPTTAGPGTDRKEAKYTQV